MKEANAALRTALDFPAGTLAGEHPALVERLRSGHSHGICLISKDGGLTCVPYAFDLAEDRLYQAIASDFNGDIFAGGEFVDWLLAGRLGELREASIGSLGLYFDGAFWRHVGVVAKTERLVSKWGTFPTYEHGFWEVPLSYGNELRFFERPSLDDARELFVEFARHQGVSLKDLADIREEVSRV